MRPEDPFRARLTLPPGYTREMVEELWPGALDEPVNRDWCGCFSVHTEGDRRWLLYEDDTPSDTIVWAGDANRWMDWR